ncbi:50S ribosomal protein L7/L12 [Candidatus Parcubacteria bacterium]|nr:50S ribosomal protein L7/L12 [Candidatus Parcubacteria bacterium]
MSEENTTPDVVEEAAAPAVEEKVEAPAATPADDAGADVEVPKKFKAVVDAIEEMSVLDLNELVKLFEKKFGVSAAAVAVAGAGAGAADAGEEQSEFSVELTSFGESKIPVMKVVKEVLGLGLKEAKELVEDAPTVVKEGMKKEDAEALKKQIEDAGGKAELK